MMEYSFGTRLMGESNNPTGSGEIFQENEKAYVRVDYVQQFVFKYIVPYLKF